MVKEFKFIHPIKNCWKSQEPIYIIRQHLHPNKYNCIGESGFLYGILDIRRDEHKAFLYDNNGFFKKQLTENQLNQMIK